MKLVSFLYQLAKVASRKLEKILRYAKNRIIRKKRRPSIRTMNDKNEDE